MAASDLANTVLAWRNGKADDGKSVCFSHGAHIVACVVHHIPLRH